MFRKTTLSIVVGAAAMVAALQIGATRAQAEPPEHVTFIVDGKVFPGGTLQKGNGMGDPNQSGSIGNRSCKGFFTSDLGRKRSAPTSAGRRTSA